MKNGNAKPDAGLISYGMESASRQFPILLGGLTILTGDNSIISPILGTGAIIHTTARLAFKSR